MDVSKRLHTPVCINYVEGGICFCCFLSGQPGSAGEETPVFDWNTSDEDNEPTEPEPVRMLRFPVDIT